MFKRFTEVVKHSQKFKILIGLSKFAKVVNNLQRVVIDFKELEIFTEGLNDLKRAVQDLQTL